MPSVSIMMGSWHANQGKGTGGESHGEALDQIMVKRSTKAGEQGRKFEARGSVSTYPLGGREDRQSKNHLTKIRDDECKNRVVIKSQGVTRVLNRRRKKRPSTN